MNTRINRCFERCRAEGRSALIVYATVGCPTPEESEALIDRLIDAGADMVELGVPFSDPMADGPVIQHAGQVALAAGTTLKKVLEIAGRIRARHPETPLILFSYYNVLFHYGLERLGAALREAEIDAERNRAALPHFRRGADSAGLSGDLAGAGRTDRLRLRRLRLLHHRARRDRSASGSAAGTGRRAGNSSRPPSSAGCRRIRHLVGGDGESGRRPCRCRGGRQCGHAQSARRRV